MQLCPPELALHSLQSGPSKFPLQIHFPSPLIPSLHIPWFVIQAGQTILIWKFGIFFFFAIPLFLYLLCKWKLLLPVQLSPKYPDLQILQLFPPLLSHPIWHIHSPVPFIPALHVPWPQFGHAILEKKKLWIIDWKKKKEKNYIGNLFHNNQEDIDYSRDQWNQLDIHIVQYNNYIFLLYNLHTKHLIIDFFLFLSFERNLYKNKERQIFWQRSIQW